MIRGAVTLDAQEESVRPLGMLYTEVNAKPGNAYLWDNLVFITPNFLLCRRITCLRRSCSSARL